MFCVFCPRYEYLISDYINRTGCQEIIKKQLGKVQKSVNKK